MKNYKSAQIAFFRYPGVPGRNVSLQCMLEGMKDGSWAGLIEKLRASQSCSTTFEGLKRRLPAFMLSAATNGGRKIVDATHHSGLLQIDIDGLDEGEVSNLRDRMGEDRHMAATWVSPSGRGVKGVMLIPADLREHKAAFDAASEYLREKYGVSIDPACSNVNRLCYVSDDPDIVINEHAVPLEVQRKGGCSGGGRGVSSASAYCITTGSALHNKAFSDYPSLAGLYKIHVERRYGRPEPGKRNATMVEIVASCFCVVAPEFVAAFAEEFYWQHAEVFGDYSFDRYQMEVKAMLAGCQRDYPQRLSEAEREAYNRLGDEEERSTFRIARSLSQCKSDATVEPPLFFLSCPNLASRLGLVDMEAWRILRAFEACGYMETALPGVKRRSGQKGVATVFRWMFPHDPSQTPPPIALTPF